MFIENRHAEADLYAGDVAELRNLLVTVGQNFCKCNCFWRLKDTLSLLVGYTIIYIWYYKDTGRNAVLCCNACGRPTKAHCTYS